MNRWNIPPSLECEIVDRDKRCVYCRVEFVLVTQTRKTKPTWEHIVNDERIITRENIARCCSSCNASKGAKNLADWLDSTYCKERGITKEVVAEVVQNALICLPKYALLDG